MQGKNTSLHERKDLMIKWLYCNCIQFQSTLNQLLVLYGGVLFEVTYTSYLD